MLQEVVLDVKNLSSYFCLSRQVIKAVDNISFQVRAGTITALVGESGCGKSVTAMSVMGLLKPPGRVIGGEIWLGKQNLREFTGEKLRQLRGKEVAMIFQEPQNALNPVLSVETQVIEAITCHQRIPRTAAKSKALMLLKKVGFDFPQQILNKYPFQLSGGMCQRIMIAIALSQNPILLIADEPTTALDVTIQAQILKELYRLKEELGVAIMLITHDLGVVAEIADHVYIMQGGRIVEAGTVYEIFQQPSHPYTKKLLSSLLPM